VTCRRHPVRWLLPFASLVVAQTALAHATLIRALPAARATLRVPPARAQLWFSEPLEPAYSTMSVWKAQHRVDRGEPTAAPENPRTLAVALPALGPGTYLVKYRVLSVDGHVAEGSYSFTVAEGAPRR
jgi:methionine-rich copper-binding protein CopC